MFEFLGKVLGRTALALLYTVTIMPILLIAMLIMAALCLAAAILVVALMALVIIFGGVFFFVPSFQE